MYEVASGSSGLASVSALRARLLRAWVWHWSASGCVGSCCVCDGDGGSCAVSSWLVASPSSCGCVAVLKSW